MCNVQCKIFAMKGGQLFRQQAGQAKKNDYADPYANYLDQTIKIKVTAFISFIYMLKCSQEISLQQKKQKSGSNTHAL